MNKWIKTKRLWRKPRWVEGTGPMYCINCAHADMLNEEANQVAFYGQDAVESIRQAARDAHSLCEDTKNCTCRHIIGLVLTPDEVARLKSQYEVPNYNER